MNVDVLRNARIFALDVADIDKFVRTGQKRQLGAYLSASRIFLILCLVFGSVYVIITPPNASPDEMAHQVKIARVAGGNLFGIDPGLPMPDVESWYGSFQNDRMASGDFGFRLADVAAVTGTKLDCRSGPRVVNDQVSSYSPILYVMPAIAYRLSCGVGATFGTYLYGARMANLLLCSVLIALSMTASTAVRWPILYVSLLPSSVFELASLSADALLLAVSMLFIAVSIGTARGEIEGRRGLWLITALGILVSFSKPSYYWVSWLGLCAYPRLRQASMPHWLLTSCLIVSPLVAQVVLLKLGIGAAAAALPDGVDPKANLAFLLHHPFALPAMISRVPTEFPFGTQWNLYESLVGKLGWLSVSLPPALYGLGAFGFVCTAGAGRDPASTRSIRVSAFCVAALSIAVIALPLSLYATPLGSRAVLGLQGRYFLPTAAIMLIAVTFRLSRKASDAAVLGVILTSVTLLAGSVVRFMETYYGVL